MSRSPEPALENDYLAEHVALLRDSLRRLAGRELPGGGLPPAQGARLLYHSPMAVLSHGTQADPVLNYANLTALGLFELSWDELLDTPSRLTAEAPEQAERARLLARVTERGWIDAYSGVRISRNGRRFRIHDAWVWNLVDDAGQLHGQAAAFRQWEAV